MTWMGVNQAWCSKVAGTEGLQCSRPCVSIIGRIINLATGHIDEWATTKVATCIRT